MIPTCRCGCSTCSSGRCSGWSSCRAARPPPRTSSSSAYAGQRGDKRQTSASGRRPAPSSSQDRGRLPSWPDPQRPMPTQRSISHRRSSSHVERARTSSSAASCHRCGGPMGSRHAGCGLPRTTTIGDRLLRRGGLIVLQSFSTTYGSPASTQMAAAGQHVADRVETRGLSTYNRAHAVTARQSLRARSPAPRSTASVNTTQAGLGR